MLYSARAGLINHLLGQWDRRAGLARRPSVALTSLVIVDVWEWSPFVVVIYAAALTSLPQEPFRAATVDGASRWQIFRHITLPLLMPVTLLVLMFRLIDTLLTLDIVVTTTFGSPGFRTPSVSGFISRACATSTLVIPPPPRGYCCSAACSSRSACSSCGSA